MTNPKDHIDLAPRSEPDWLTISRLRDEVTYWKDKYNDVEAKLNAMLSMRPKNENN